MENAQNVLDNVKKAKETLFPAKFKVLYDKEYENFRQWKVRGFKETHPLNIKIFFITKSQDVVFLKKGSKFPPVTSLNEVSELRRSFPQILAVCIKNMVLFVYGTSVGMPTILIPNLSGNNPDESIVLNQEEISWIGSLLHLCVPIGCVLSGIICPPLGRRGALQLCTVPFLIGYLLFIFSTQTWHIFFGLSLLGMSGGLIEAPALSYTAETTEPNLRGALTSTSTFFISLGLLLTFILGSFISWRTVSIVNAAIPLVIILLLFLVPETPYWLISRNRLEHAQKSLAWLRGWTTTTKVEKEFVEIQEDIKKHADEKLEGTLKLYIKGSFLKPFLLIILTFAVGHFGISPVTIYAVEIYSLLNVPISSYYATILNGCVNLAGTTTCVIILRHTGKRLLMYISLTGVCICFCIAAVYSYMVDIKYFDQATEDISSTYSWIPLTSLALMGFFSYIMIFGLPWILIGEIYHNEIRDVASGLSAATGYLIGFTANKTFLDMVSSMTLAGVFWFYSAVALVGLVLLIFLLPETEGKTLVDISEHYAGGRKLDNKVLRSSTKST